MSDGMKYICVNEGFGDQIYIFPNIIGHDIFAERQKIDRKWIVGAGFVNQYFECYGKSTSLGIKSRIAEDNLAIQKNYPDWDDTYDYYGD